MQKSLCATTSKRLLRIKGLSDTKVEKIKEAAKKLSVSLLILMMPTNLTMSSQAQQASSLLLSFARYASDASEYPQAASNLTQLSMGRLNGHQKLDNY